MRGAEEGPLFRVWSNAESLKVDVLVSCVSVRSSYSDFRGRLTTLERSRHRFELTQKITEQFQR
jgi:hypothetical protein